MKRRVYTYLKAWKDAHPHKPLIINGARQIGKTTTVRQFASKFFNLIEINLESQPDIHAIFEQNLDPERLIIDLQLITGKTITPKKCLLFIDEIQACPRAITALRYFYEKMPELHVIAAGSLLQFAIDKVGVPVGRIAFLHMYPMSFLEFLEALGESLLAEAIQNQDGKTPFNSAVHQKALRLFGEYIAIGGMPEAVAAWRDTHHYQSCLEIHHDLIAAYKQDFEKYARKTQIKYIEHLFQEIPHFIGKQFRYSHITGHYRKRELEPALYLLEKANVVSPVHYTAAQGIPLGAQTRLDNFKLIPLDIALNQAALGLTSEEWILDPEKTFINKGTITEAFVGQELLAYANPRQNAALYYWHREERGSQAEIDYVIARNGAIVPIEVKSGKGSSLKSMQCFLNDHPTCQYGVRFSTHNFSQYEKIYSYPLYSVCCLTDQNSV
ncbi:MAG: AAA family ATPase [Gammaproteobacteria bacterium]|nr:AAA family ATPase [Gammaproteobacteria bacterium]